MKKIIVTSMLVAFSFSAVAQNFSADSCRERYMVHAEETMKKAARIERIGSGVAKGGMVSIFIGGVLLASPVLMHAGAGVMLAGMIVGGSGMEWEYKIKKALATEKAKKYFRSLNIEPESGMTRTWKNIFELFNYVEKEVGGVYLNEFLDAIDEGFESGAFCGDDDSGKFMNMRKMKQHIVKSILNQR